MLMKLSSIVLVLSLAVFASPTDLQAQARAGDKEVLVQGSLISTFGDASLTNATGVFGLGYFVSSRLQVGVQPIISISSFSIPTFDSRGFPTGNSDTEITTRLGSAAKAQYYFGADQAKLKPYAGGSLIINDFSDAGDTSFAAAVFGFKNYLTEKAALDINGSFGFGLTSPGSIQVLQIFAGFSYIF
jgi:outer membrane protein W